MKSSDQLLSKKNLLFVDDNPLSLLIYKNHIQEQTSNQTYRFLSAKNYQEAIQIVNQEEIHCIICDLEIPGNSGLEILSYTKKHQPKASLILATGSTHLDSLLYAVNEISVDKIFIKPLDLSSTGLFHVISQILGRSK